MVHCKIKNSLQNHKKKNAEINKDIVEINTLNNQLDVTDYIDYLIQLNTHSSQAYVEHSFTKADHILDHEHTFTNLKEIIVSTLQTTMESQNISKTESWKIP